MLRDLSTSSQDEPFQLLTCDSVGIEKLFSNTACSMASIAKNPQEDESFSLPCANVDPSSRNLPPKHFLSHHCNFSITFCRRWDFGQGPRESPELRSDRFSGFSGYSH